MQNIFAHTDAGHDYPAFISINKDADGRHRVTVRSGGNGGLNLGEIHVSPETLEHMATDVLAAIDGPLGEDKCCGKCEKSPAEQAADDFMRTMEESSRPGAEPTHYSGLGSQPAEQIDWRERYMRDVEGLNNEGDPIGGEPAMGLRQVVERQQAAINELVQRLQTADLLIQALLFKAGGEVTVTAAECDSIPGHMVVNDTAEDRSSFTFRLVKASTVEVAQVQ